MLQINIKWRPLIYTNHYDYAHKRNVPRIEEHCKLHHLLQIVIKNAGEALSKEILLRLSKEFEEETGIHIPPESLLLSNQTWGESATYDKDTDIYTDSICVAKDFDSDMKQQKREIMAFIRQCSLKIIGEHTTVLTPCGIDYDEYYQ